MKAKTENSDGPTMQQTGQQRKKVQKSMTKSDIELVDIIYRYGGEQAIESMRKIPPLMY